MAPVFAFSETSRKPVVTYTIRSSPLPSLQYDTPRPDNCRGDTTARFPSRMLCVQSTSPVLPSSATTALRTPAVL